MSDYPDFTPPKVIHQFPKGEIVQDMVKIEKRKHWFSKKKAYLYIMPNNGMYEMESK